MLDDAVERFPDVLQNIELAIFRVYEVEPRLLDLDVIDALDGLVRKYGAEEQSRTPPKLRLSTQAMHFYDAAEQMCEWRLGRATIREDSQASVIPPDERIEVGNLVMCLKRIRKSVHIWSEQGGRQGYLDYISEFLARSGGHPGPSLR